MKERKFEVRENKKQDIEKQQFLYGVKHKSLCLQDIQTLKHCVGLDYISSTRKKYKPFRNYFEGVTPSVVRLMNIGLIECIAKSLYRATEQGFWFLEELMDISIDYQNILKDMEDE